MHSPLLQRLLAEARIADLRRTAASSRRRRARGPVGRPPAPTDVTLRFAFPDDGQALARLAALDSALPPPAPVLLAESGGVLRAAISLEDGSVIADPFHYTAPHVQLLRARAKQLSKPQGGVARGRSGRLLAALRAVTFG